MNFDKTLDLPIYQLKRFFFFSKPFVLNEKYVNRNRYRFASEYEALVLVVKGVELFLSVIQHWNALAKQSNIVIIVKSFANATARNWKKRP